MTARVKFLRDRQRPSSLIRMHPGQGCNLTLQISDGTQPINWEGHRPRFRIYSQRIDRLVVFETTDPRRCAFEPDGIWRLQLSSKDTASIPCGGMRFTLEHCEPESGEFRVGVLGSVSCTELRVDDPHKLAPPTYAR